ncbi:hypothetical protein CDL15_Pgr017203 [Punica granatum]|uniref:Uncharacterized protein n=1 Tax=Punica granatum TaxID=22663 RepID=A0A218WDQ8_PUNGR|nr:hypothetical protein CDL15_Pgr017203 [Punica granatum]
MEREQEKKLKLLVNLAVALSILSSSTGAAEYVRPQPRKTLDFSDLLGLQQNIWVSTWTGDAAEPLHPSSDASCHLLHNWDIVSIENKKNQVFPYKEVLHVIICRIALQR